jgi:hypothetical protein
MAKFKIHGVRAAAYDYNNYCGFHRVFCDMETGEMWTRTYAGSNATTCYGETVREIYSGYSVMGVFKYTVTMKYLKAQAEFCRDRYMQECAQ